MSKHERLKKRDKGPSREREQADLIEGRHPVAEALASGRSLNKAWVLKSQAGKRHEQRLEGLIEQLKAQKVPLHWTDRAGLDRISPTGKHQGLVVQAAAQDYQDADAVLERCEQAGKDPLLLILDGLQDGRNLGASVRIAEGMGVDMVVLPSRRSVALDSYVQRASAGALAHLPVARVGNLSQFFERLKAQGFWIYGLDAAGADCYDEVDYRGKLALVLGSEGKGISQKLKGHCDRLLSIPMQGKVNSLNASVACGIVCATAMRQRQAQP